MLDVVSDPTAAQAGRVEADFQRALDNLALDAVCLLTKWVPLAYVLILPASFVRFSAPVAWKISLLQALCAAALALFGLGAARGKIPLRRARATLAAVLAVPVAIQLWQAYVIYAPSRLSLYGLFIVGIGLFCLSAGWLAVLLSAAIGGWCVLIRLSPESGPTLAASAIPLGVALFIALLARATRLAGVAHLEQLRRQEQQHLKDAEANEAKFRGIFNRIHDVFFRTDMEGRIEMISPSVGRYGYRPEDLIGTNALPFYADARERERLIKLLITQGQVSNHELRFLRRDGVPVIATMNANPLLDEHGRMVGLEGLLHDVTERTQEEARQKAEAQDAAMLAHVGQELIASLDEPSLLNRLCELTSEVFACDASHTFLLGERGIVIAAGHGDTPEQRESLHVLEIPPEIAAPLLGRLRSEGLAQTVLQEPRDPATSPIPPGYGITSALYFPLRKREEIVGFQSVAFRGRTDPLDERQVRLLRRVAHLASLALENARLLDALERANDFKARFLANMSHELRTPLNVIMGYNQILLDHGCGPLAAAQAAMLERVQANAGELLNLVCATLELSREETRDVPLELGRVEIPSLMQSLAEERRALLSNQKLVLQFDAPPQLPLLYTDPRKLRMVLKNLIDNAVKFTEAGSVTVEARPAEEGVQFRVIDTGMGIHADDLEVIFEPFRQGATPAGSLDGVGLGLYIVRTLLTALRGTIDVESQPGRGSTFRIWLPWTLDTETALDIEDIGVLGGRLGARFTQPH